MWAAPRLKPDSEWTTVDSMDEVEARIESVRGETRGRDARTMLKVMRRATGQDPVVNRSGFGFGRYRYVARPARSFLTHPILVHRERHRALRGCPKLVGPLLARVARAFEHVRSPSAGR
ncbi:hypothetical protein GCM10023152_26480 [Agromyces bauzanensis]|uniref:Uncharacterized protein n=1 Tax=Agromyces bauzanensis TaxID=1308924 RepID=A0A917UXK4_9MICO|nr:hypothetical protein GCM10011372_34800 [Agromyces bauzanensis]